MDYKRRVIYAKKPCYRATDYDSYYRIDEQIVFSKDVETMGIKDHLTKKQISKVDILLSKATDFNERIDIYLFVKAVIDNKLTNLEIPDNLEDMRVIYNVIKEEKQVENES